MRIDTRIFMPAHLRPYVTVAEANEAYVGGLSACLIAGFPLGFAPWAGQWWSPLVSMIIGGVICYVPANRLLRRAQNRQNREKLS